MKLKYKCEICGEYCEKIGVHVRYKHNESPKEYYDGTYWHADSRFYKATDYVSSKHCTAQEIWDYDNNKINECSKLNIKLIRIKEYDWLNSNDEVKEKIKTIILNNK